MIFIIYSLRLHTLMSNSFSVVMLTAILFHISMIAIKTTKIILFKYCILPVSSRSYYKFQVEIGAATNRDFNIEIARKTLIYGLQA